MANGNGSYIGIDVGGTKTLVCVASESGEVRLTEKMATSGHESPTAFFEWLFRELNPMLARAGISLNEIRGIGMGFPGVIGADGGSLSHAPALPWPHENLLPLIARYYEGPVKLGNDVNMALLGECWQGSARGKRHVLMLTVGTGIGGAMLLNGSLYEGAAGGAGEAGYSIVDVASLPPGGSLNGEEFGPLESVTSGTGIAAEAKAYFAKRLSAIGGSDALSADSSLWVQAGGRLDGLNAPLVLAGAMKGDADALAIMDRPLGHMAAFIGTACSLLNPELVLLGGGVADSGDYYTNEIIARVEGLTPFPVAIGKASLGNRAGAIGAAAAAASIFR